jgi:hypothetical protein
MRVSLWDVPGKLHERKRSSVQILKGHEAFRRDRVAENSSGLWTGPSSLVKMVHNTVCCGTQYSLYSTVLVRVPCYGLCSENTVLVFSSLPHWNTVRSMLNLIANL